MADATAGDADQFLVEFDAALAHERLDDAGEDERIEAELIAQLLAIHSDDQTIFIVERCKPAQQLGARALE